MDMERAFQKAEHLFRQDRYGEAQNEIKNYLSTNPEDVDALIMLAQTHIGLGQDEKADEIVDDILKLDASNPIVLYLKGVTQARLAKRKEALNFLNLSLSLDPTLVMAHGVKAMVYFNQANFEEALASANAGLELDPQDEMCLNQRSRALLKLGRKEDQLEADQQALRNNPMNSQTHATVGFSELERGNIKKAKEHFREALRIDPNNDFARSGMMHAIKGSNLFYSLFLKYIFWMQGLRPQVRWAVIIIGYLLIQVLNNYSGELGVFSTAAEFVVYLYILFAISTWIIGPVSNIFLRFHAFGKYLLTESEVKTANISAALLSSSVIGAAIFFGSGENFFWKNFGFYLLCCGIAMTIVVSSIENATLEKSKRNLKTAGMIFGVACIALLALSLTLPGLAMQLFTWIIYGFLGFQFYANSQE